MKFSQNILVMVSLKLMFHNCPMMSQISRMNSDPSTESFSCIFWSSLMFLQSDHHNMQGGQKRYLLYLRIYITCSIHCVPTRQNFLDCCPQCYSVLGIRLNMQFLILLSQRFPSFVIDPHPQARATLIHILELQIQRRKQAVEDIKRYSLFSDLGFLKLLKMILFVLQIISRTIESK